MGVSGGPYIVRDSSLVLELDASDLNSYVSGSTTWYDLSGNNRNETLTNTSFSFGSNGVIVFNGTNSSGSYKSNPITGNSAFTLSGWLNTGTHTTYGIAVYMGNATTNNSAYIGYVTSSQSGSANSIGGGFYGINFGSGVAVNTGWHSVVLSYAGGANALATLYVDGTARVSGTQNPNLSSTAINLGAANTGSAYWYSGSIANVQLYNRALSQQEITQNFNALRTRFNV